MARWFGRKQESRARGDRLRLGNDVEAARVDAAVLRRKVLLGLVIIAAFITMLELMFPTAVPGGGVEPQLGQVAREEIVAPFDFDVLKSDDELRQERAMAEGGVVPVFRFDETVQTSERKRLADFLTRVYEMRAGSEPEQQKIDMLGELGVALSDTTRRMLLNARASSAIEEGSRGILYALYEAGILRVRGAPPLLPEGTVMLIRGDEETVVRVQQYLRETELASAIEQEASRTAAERPLRKAMKEVVLPFLRGNVAYDAVETQRRRRDARERISEYTGRDFKKDETIVSRGERITEEHLTILRSMELRRAQLLRMEAGHKRFFPALGRILLAALLLGVFILYASVRKLSMLNETRCYLLFGLLVAVVMAGAAVISRIPDASPYLLPIAVLAMLASTLLGFEIAAVSTVITVLLAAVYTGFGLPFTLVSLVAGVVAAHSVRRVRHREDFYWSGIKVALAYGIAIVAADVSRVDVGFGTLTRCGWGGLNAIVSMGVVVVALPLMERGFRVTTDITLLELGDMNKPLLRKMAMTAPGSYHHSIVVGNLAEAAAEAIGADGLLARVGSYYHDIGKLVQPAYFVENQQGLDADKSKHTGLRPKVSNLIIASHVKDGVELAKKEGLPEPIIDIVREHHGTSLMEFFYNKALEEAGDATEINKADYSYPGPRARSKESALIMLADTVEARVRSIGDSLTPKRIESEIGGVIERRWHEGQLDDSELTLRDLSKIRDAFVRVVVGMYHQRVKYPDQEGGGEAVEPC